MKVVIVIPARFRSSRFPGKPLVQISGKSMIRRVWERCISVVPASDVYVATDDDRIMAHCRNGAMSVIMTPQDCATGTDRVSEAAKQISADLYINVQGDEPLIEPEDISAIIKKACECPSEVINGMCPIDTEEDFRSPTVPKVVTRLDGRLLYMSRSAIPTTKMLSFASAMKQVCIYAFDRSALEAFSAVLEKTPLERIEDIEILRFLEIGRNVQMVEVSRSSIAVDIPADLERVERAIRERNL